MCGIAGQYKFNDEPVDRNLVRQMTRRLAHRGPDSSGHFFARNIGLGHQRLAVIDLEGSHQPMFDHARRLCLVSNNEVYNYLELRAELEAKGHLFATSGDSEVILTLFKQERENCFSRFEGMFAIAIWDQQANTLFLARDPFGIKPLYYYQDSSALIFASEMKALLEYPGLDRQLDLAAMDGYFASLALPEPRSVFRAVRKVPPGHFLKVHAGKTTLTRYFDPARAFSSGVRRNEKPGDLEKQLREKLERAIKISLRSDVPVGFLLSGGVDSSAVAAIAARQSASPVHTFSAAFEESEFNESPYSRLVSQQFRTTHHEVLVTKARATRIASRLAELMDEPFADSSGIPTYAVCELARKHVKILISGEGADELFGGYPWHVPSTGPSHDWEPMALAEHPARIILNQRERNALYSADWKTELLRHRNGSRSAGPREKIQLSSLNRSLLQDLQVYLPSDILYKSDRVSMIHSLEMRVPFLNRPFAEFAMALPDNMKVRRKSRKYLFKRAVADLLPESVLKRPKKGFSIPLDLWLWEKGPWREMIYDTIFGLRTRQRGQFNMKMLERLQHEHDRLEGLHGYKLWTVYTFEAWQRAFLDSYRRVA